jgi:hypothetical protein
MIDHPHMDPGDGRTECEVCGKWVWLVIHSCKGVPVTERARERYAERQQNACRSRTRYGRCGRPTQHGGPHAMPVGDGVWYGYADGRTPLGYGRFDGDTFTSITNP